MRRRYHVHPPGLLYLVLVVVVAIAAANRPSNLLIWVFAAMLSGVLLSGILSGQPLMGVHAERSVPRTGRISCSTTSAPASAACQAASDPASPPPTTWIVCPFMRPG